MVDLVKEAFNYHCDLRLGEFEPFSKLRWWMSAPTTTILFDRRLCGFCFLFQQSTSFCIGICDQTVNRMPRTLAIAGRLTNAIFQRNIAATGIQRRET